MICYQPIAYEIMVGFSFERQTPYSIVDVSSGYTHWIETITA
jgi:hypothetical protein